MTAFLTGWPSWALARSRSLRRIMALTSCGLYSWSPSLTLTAWPILRLIDLTVRSGARTHWLRAALPTSNFPSSEMPTNDGRMGSPSSSKTTGWPSRTMATSLLVVPRSMPTIGSIAAPSPPHPLPNPSPTQEREQEDSIPRHAHQGTAHHAPALPVAAPHLFDHLAAGPTCPRHRLQRLHRFG